MVSGSSYFHVQVVRAHEREQAKQHFLSNGKAYTRGYLYAHRRRGRWINWIFPDSEYEGARDALKELS